jgi:hypothetical protein
MFSFKAKPLSFLHSYILTFLHGADQQVQEALDMPKENEASKF